MKDLIFAFYGMQNMRESKSTSSPRFSSDSVHCFDVHYCMVQKFNVSIFDGTCVQVEDNQSTNVYMNIKEPQSRRWKIVFPSGNLEDQYLMLFKVMQTVKSTCAPLHRNLPLVQPFSASSSGLASVCNAQDNCLSGPQSVLSLGGGRRTR